MSWGLSLAPHAAAHCPGSGVDPPLPSDSTVRCREKIVFWFLLLPLEVDAGATYPVGNSHSSQCWKNS